MSPLTHRRVCGLGYLMRLHEGVERTKRRGAVSRRAPLTHVHVCPKCFSDDIERVPKRRALDRVVRVLGWHVYHCLECGTRFYDRRADAEEPEERENC